MGTKYIAVIAIYKEISDLAAFDITGISTAIVIMIGVILLIKLLVPD